jgi:hypothetical protein
MKKAVLLLSLITSSSVFSGQMGKNAPEPKHTSYIFAGGGYYGGIYEKLDLDYDDGLLETMTSSDAAHSDGYGQIGIGAGTSIDKFVFDHQLSVLKLGGANLFNSPHSHNKFQ